MRNKKLIKGKSTKAERRFHELLKKSHIPFKCKVKIEGREVDFLIGKYAIEIDGHQQDVLKNKMLIEKGYNPIHFNNWEINETLIDWLKTICLEQIYLPHQE
jgi:very-short-patch-repair endonuclease